jgi:hypothetical protein
MVPDRIFATGYTMDELIRETQKIENGIPSDFPCYLCKRKEGQDAAVIFVESETGDTPPPQSDLKIAPRTIKLTPFTLTIGGEKKIKVTYMLCMECRALLAGIVQQEKGEEF